MLLLMAVGYTVTKLGVLSVKARAEITNIVIYVILPCNVFLSFHKGIDRGTLLQCGVIFLVALCAQLLYIVLNRLLYNRFDESRRVVLKYATICNNAGFMGLPIIESVFGENGLLFGSIVLIPIRVFMWTAGLSLFTKTDLKRKVKTLATHPCIWAVILGLAYSFAPFTLPSFLSGALGALGSCTTALSMIIVGSILSEVPLRGVLDKSCFYYSAIRLVAIPALIFGVLKLIGTDALVTGVAVLSTAMPAATTTAMLAQKYNADAAFAAKTIFVSTVLSLVTLPLVSWFIA
jgi:predicted permease